MPAWLVALDYPRLIGMLLGARFRIQADVTDGTMSTVVVLFDEVAELLVRRTAKSLVDEQLKVLTLRTVDIFSRYTSPVRVTFVRLCLNCRILR